MLTEQKLSQRVKASSKHHETEILENFDLLTSFYTYKRWL